MTRLARAAAATSVALCALAGLYRVRTYDTFFHLAAGRWVLAHGEPRTDPFSCSFRGAPWHDHSWGWEALLELVRRAGGMPALSLAQALSAGVLAVVALASVRARPSRFVAAALLLPLPFAALRETLEARPQVAGFVALGAACALLVRAEETGDRRAVLGALAMQLVLLPMHATHVLVTGLLGLATVAALVRRDRRGALAAAAALAVAVAATVVVAPESVALDVAHSGSAFARADIAEWQPISLETLAGHPGGPVFVGAFVLSLVGAWLAVARPALDGRGPRGPFALAALALFAVAALTSWRLLALFLLGATPLWLPHAAHAAVTLADELRLRAPARLAAGALSLAAAVAILAAGSATFVPGAGLDARRFPVRAVDEMARNGRVTRVYDAYNFGGYLIDRGVPRDGVLVDGRALTVYPERFLAEFDSAYADPRVFERLAARYAVDGVLLPASSPKVARLRGYLDASPRWQRTFADPVAVLWEPRR